MTKQGILYEGKAKQVLSTDETNVFIQRFKDSATAFNGEKKADFAGKGETNNAISSFLFSALEKEGLKTHFIDKPNATDMKVHRLSIIPIEFVVRNIVAGSLAKRTGLEEGAELREPIVETYYKKDELGDPLFADTHVFMLNILPPEQLDHIKELSLRVNEILVPLFLEAGMKLVDFKLEFGFDADNNILLGDEISPDTCRLWDKATNRKLDKDVFRREIGDLMEVYHIVAQRLGIEL